MIQASIQNAHIHTKANVFFDGKCVSHAITLADGTKKSVGVILASSLTFNTDAAEVMECVYGECTYKLAGSTQWLKSVAGERFNVPAKSSFEITVADQYHYICHFG